MAGTSKDVWYKFTATATTNYTVTLSNLGPILPAREFKFIAAPVAALTLI